MDKNNQQVMIMPEGYVRTQKRDAQRNNIMAARMVADTIRTTLGPKGMDKMLVDSSGNVVITNDGVTILRTMDIEHPAAKMMVEIAKTQEEQVGDGTTTSVVIAGSLLKKAEELLDQEVHPTVITKGYMLAQEKAQEILKKISIKIDLSDDGFINNLIKTCIGTKIANSQKLVDELTRAVRILVQDGKFNPEDLKLVKKVGKSIDDSEIVNGVVVDRPALTEIKKVDQAKIALISHALEMEKTETEAKININSPEQMQSFLDQEERMLKHMATKIIESGANVVLCQKSIDDIVQHFLAKAGMLIVSNISQGDMIRLAKSTSGKIVKSLEDLTSTDLGDALIVEEEDNTLFVRGCNNPKSISLLIHGGTEHVVDEVERSISDAVGILKVVIQPDGFGLVVPGGGAPEMSLSKELSKYAETLGGREQLAVKAFAEAMEVIPRTLAENSGLDPIDMIAGLKSEHEKGNSTFGVNIITEEPGDMIGIGIIEPTRMKSQAIQSATEVAVMILRIDDVIAAGKIR